MNGSNIYEVKYNGNEICLIKCNGSVLWEKYITLIDYIAFDAFGDGNRDRWLPTMPWLGDNINLDNIIMEEELLAENTSLGDYFGEQTSYDSTSKGNLYRRKIKSKEEPNGFNLNIRDHETNSVAGFGDPWFFIPKIYKLCNLQDVTSASLNFKISDAPSFVEYNFDFFSDKTFRKLQNCEQLFVACDSLTDADLAKLTGFMSQITEPVECSCLAMFSACKNLTKIENIPWEKILPTDTMMMFSGCTSLTTLNLSYLDLSKCNDEDSLSIMFGWGECTALNKVAMQHCNAETVVKVAKALPDHTGAAKNQYQIYISNSSTEIQNAVLTALGPMYNGWTIVCTSASKNYITVYEVDSASNTIVPTIEPSTVAFTEVNSYPYISLNYDDITNSPTRISFSISGGNTALKNVLFVSGTTHLTNMASMFGNCKALVSVDTTNWDTSNVTNMGGVFATCESLTTLDLSSFDTSKTTIMTSMFSGCNALTSLDLSNFDTSKVTTMASMFNNCKALTTLDLSNFDMTNVTSTTSMFSSCVKLTTLRLDNCSNATIKKIITSQSFPIFDAFAGGHNIYCKRDNATDLVPPQGWRFTYID